MGRLSAQKLVTYSTAVIFALAVCFVFVVPALASTTAEIENLQDEVSDKQAEIDQINKRIEDYKNKANEYSKQTASLLNDIAMIENQVAIAELDVQATQNQIESKNLEIEILQEKIKLESDRLLKQKAMLKEMIFALHRKDDIGFIEVLFGADNFNELFEEIEQLESVNRDLNSALDTTKLTKDSLEENNKNQEESLGDLVELQSDLKMQALNLENQISSKDLLVSETQASEAKYRVLMSELRQESQYVTNQIAELQNELERKLAEGTNPEDLQVGLMTSPLDDYITTATFHDPTYPFRHLWEHSGHDMAAPTGTPIKAAGSGIVAWTKTGNSYGNYVMIIHGGGYATLYAHMSRFNTSADAFVSRGQVIGYVGSTGFSTGPHLHFEVRLNGIPVNPAAYVSGVK